MAGKQALTYVEMDVDFYRATDFGETPVGITPSDWSVRVKSSPTTTILSVNTDYNSNGLALHANNTTGANNSPWVWNKVPDMINQSATMSFVMANSSVDQPQLNLRTSGFGGNNTANGYMIRWTAANIELREYTNAGGTSLLNTAPHGITWTANTPVHLRLNVSQANSTTALLSGYVWTGNVLSVPEDISISLTHTANLNPGKSGFDIPNASNSKMDVFYFQTKELDDSSVEQTYRFCIPNGYQPIDIECIPSIRSVNFTPQTVSLGKNLGQRAVVTTSFKDHRHTFDGETYAHGTFWGKWRGRYGQRLRGKDLRLIRGNVGEAIGSMETHHYSIESVNGPSVDGTYTVTAKDIFKFADGDRAQAPVMSKGYLETPIAANTTTATLLPAGIGNLEYASSGYVAIGGKEICSFTRTSDTLTLTRGQLGTTAQAHEDEDRVQTVLIYEAQDPSTIIQDLLVTYTGVSNSFITLSDWTNETETYYGRMLAATISDPVSVQTLLSEIIEQAGLSLWWDDINQQVRLRVLRKIPETASVYTENNILRGSLSTQEQPNSRISQVWTYYGQRNSLEPIDNIDNYRSIEVTLDLDSEDDYGGAAIKKIYSRWIPAFGKIVAERTNGIQLARFVDPPRKFNFSIHRTDPITPVLGGGYRLEWEENQDDIGNMVSAPLQVTRLNPLPDRYELQAEEMLFREDLIPELPDLIERKIFIDTDINNINLRQLHDTIYPEPTGTESPEIDIRFRILSDVVVGSTNILNPAVDVGDWPIGITILIENYGIISGMGGQGGSGDFSSPRDDGFDGGLAFKTEVNIDLDNQGTIQGGGGGGAGYGGSGHGTGGGGAGRLGGPKGVNAVHGDGYPGQPGSLTVGGEGGGYSSFQAGDGGNPGQAGDPNSGAGQGGAAGVAIDGDSLINYVNAGTILGAQIN